MERVKAEERAGDLRKTKPDAQGPGVGGKRCQLRDRVRTTKQVLTEVCLVRQRDRWALALRSQRWDLASCLVDFDRQLD